VPLVIPVTTPVDGSTVATDGVPLLQLPLGVPDLLNTMLDPAHTEVGPVIVPALATLLTTIGKAVLVVPQPFVTVYVMVAFPAATPVTAPVDAFTVATSGVPLVQVPFASPLLLSGEIAPTQIGEVPEIVPAFGAAFTVTVVWAVCVPQLFVML